MNKKLKLETVDTAERKRNSFAKSKSFRPNFLVYTRNKKGITLVALVVTVIILIILATVSINIILREDGLIRRAEQAKELYQNAQEEEETQIAKYVNEMNDYANEMNGYANQTNDDGNDDSNNDGNNDGNDTVNGETTVEDYTTDLIYKLNLNNLNSQSGVTITGNGITVSDDKKYATFDGSSCITVNNDTIDPEQTIRTTQDTTLCCWYRTNSSTGNQEILMGFGEDGSDYVRNKHYLLKSYANIGAGQGYSTIVRNLDPSNVLDNNWHFVVGVWKNQNTLDFYYDGVPFTATGSYTQSNTFLDIAGDYKSNSFYKGDLADIRVYKAALTEAQVKQLYAYGKQYLGIN